jgi:hypothetical protein
MDTDKKVVRDNDEGEGPDAKGATEEDNIKIDTIKGSETLGYKGEAHEEHTGQTGGRKVPDPEGDVADQNPKIKHSSH